MLDATDLARALTVPCPRTACAAFCGERCVSYATGRALDIPHDERVEEAAKTRGSAVSTLVYQAAHTSRGVWHWPKPIGHITRREIGAACLSYPLTPATGRNPVSIRIEDRCRGNGCCQRWDAWLRATVHACLLAEAGQP